MINVKQLFDIVLLAAIFSSLTFVMTLGMAIMFQLIIGAEIDHSLMSIAFSGAVVCVGFSIWFMKSIKQAGNHTHNIRRE